MKLKKKLAVNCAWKSFLWNINLKNIYMSVCVTNTVNSRLSRVMGGYLVPLKINKISLDHPQQFVCKSEKKHI